VVCGNPANYTQRTIQSTERVVVGASDIYEARCRNCYEPPEAEEKEVKLPRKNRGKRKARPE
jgi:thymidine kinase